MLDMVENGSVLPIFTLPIISYVRGNCVVALVLIYVVLPGEDTGPFHELCRLHSFRKVLYTNAEHYDVL